MARSKKTRKRRRRDDDQAIAVRRPSPDDELGFAADHMAETAMRTSPEMRSMKKAMRSAILGAVKGSRAGGRLRNVRSM